MKWKTQKIKVSNLKEFEKNPRKMTKKGLSDLKKSIQKFGLAEPIVVNTDMTICGGHGRLQVLKELGIKTWVSMEPVFDVEESFKVLDKIKNIVDHVKIGKINGFSELEAKYDWEKYTKDAIEYCRKNNLKFYIKKSLQKFCDPSIFQKHEIDSEFLDIKNTNSW